MKGKGKQTASIGMVIGAAVIDLVAAQKQISQGSITDELVRLGRRKGSGMEDEVPVQATRLAGEGTQPTTTLPGNPFTYFITAFIPWITVQ